ncbi:hypothetical protein Lbir_2006 [Legionella birminghamensis]|uniref:Uncharacterized protein n=1 Tax=Legionella birminghamensis TaxID=28083 RepID=A0A378I8Q5_9GAMM|nr:hypothetical protein [Legionella birminghamensis]KTC69267.1 hypothetical protein Lbir_2006 [Legionella birminghamensis]STX31529.1 Uncharacterised protein [Legionella birminghamensis]
MKHYIAWTSKMLPALLVLLMTFGTIQSVQAQVNTTSPQTTLAGKQLAYYYGGHWYRYPGHYYGPGYIYYGPRYYNRHYYKNYWTGWRPYGHCRKTCLINQWNGQVIRCVRRC